VVWEPGTEMAISLGWIPVCSSVMETAPGGACRSRLAARETTESRDQLRECVWGCVCL